MTKKSYFILLSFLVIWTFLTIISVTWGNRFDWPDNVHVDYGFPMVWSTQTLSTISGSVNLWSVDVSVLIMNLIIWLGIMLIATAVLLWSFNKKRLMRKNNS